jgi:cytidylate kinase
MAVIAMTREMATRGIDVARGVAEQLGLSIVHHEVVEHDVAQLSGLSESEVHRFLEGKASLLERFRIDGNRMSRYTAHEIVELAAKGNVLIRGWGAGYLLRSIPHIVCVRICAPIEYREQVLMDRLHLSDRKAARREIDRNDHTHNAVMQRLYSIDWRAPWQYAVVLNTARVPIADCVDYIVKLATSQAFAETPQSRSNLMDILVAARVRHALIQRFESSGHTIGIEPMVSQGKVTLTGACSDAAIITEVVRAVHAIDGVKSVESKIEHITFVPVAGV